VAQDEPHVSVGGLLEAGQSGKKDILGKESVHKESDSWKEAQHVHACKEDLTMVGLGFW
jgi:hypothetical protein